MYKILSSLEGTKPHEKLSLGIPSFQFSKEILSKDIHKELPVRSFNLI